MLVIDPGATLLTLVAGTAVGVATRNVTVGGLTAIALAPAVLALLGATRATVAGVAVACALVLIAHHPSFDRRRAPAVITNAPRNDL
jgi:hypothetical protein